MFAGYPASRLKQDALPILDVMQSPEAPNGPGEEEDVASPLKAAFLDAMAILDKLYRKAQQVETKLASMTRNMRPKAI